jgi:ADP-heptose:LPS heptosyltransferase
MQLDSDPIVDISRSFEEARAIENIRVPKKIADQLWIILMGLLIGLLRIFFWFFQNYLLGLKHPKKDLMIKNIVIYFDGMLGDVSVHLPAVKLIKDNFPDSRFICICNSQGFPFGDYLSDVELFHETIVLNGQPVIRKGIQFLITDTRLLNIRADLFINLSPFSNLGILGYLAREMIFAKKLGSKYYLGDSLAFYNFKNRANRIRRFFIRNEPRRSICILNALGIRQKNMTVLSMLSTKNFPIHLLKIGSDGKLQPYAVLNPGAKFAVKQWPAVFFGRVAKYLNEHYGYTVYITGSSGEVDLAQDVIDYSDNTAISLCGKTTISQLFQVLRCAEITVTNDTGPMHLSAILNRPTVAIFGTRMSLLHWYPVGELTTVITHYHKDSFSYDDDGMAPHRLEKISTDIIINQIDQLLRCS